jgi:hypothetical protein
MNTYVAIIDEKAVLAFRAVDDDQAHAIIDDQEGSMRSDLKVLVGTDGKPLWDGKSAICKSASNLDPGRCRRNPLYSPGFLGNR